MCKDLRCEICDKQITKIPKYCSRKCKGKDAKTWGGVATQFMWKNATDEEKEEHLRKRYEANVIKKDGCWDWNKAAKHERYMRMHYSRNEPKLSIHVYSWRLHNGSIPEGMCVLHKCDNKRCSNPEHLYLGTNKDNIVDMINKKRHPHGETHGCAKLTEQQVKEIKRLLLLDELSHYAIARKFNVAHSTIFNIKNSRTWKHVVVD